MSALQSGMTRVLTCTAHPFKRRVRVVVVRTGSVAVEDLVSRSRYVVHDIA